VALAGLGVNDIFPVLQRSHSGGDTGLCLILRDPLGMSHPLTAVPAITNQSLPRQPRPAQWNQTDAHSNETQKNALNQLQSVTALQNKKVNAPPKVQRLWEQKKVTLLELKNCLKNSRLNPLVQGMCFRMFKEAFDTDAGATQTKSLDTERCKILTCYVLATALALETMDPLGVSCSQFPFLHATLRSTLRPIETQSVLRLLTGLPTYESEGVTSADWFSLCILKAVVTDWGHRPQGRIMQNAIGHSNTTEGQAFAFRLACNLLGEQQKQSLPGGHRVGWEMVLSPTGSLTELRQGLLQWGADNWLTLPVHTDTGQPATLVKVCLPQANNVPAQKWCFEEGFTMQIHTTDLTVSHVSSQRVILPWGKGAKQQQITVLEHRWMDEVVQVIPNEADVARLAAESGFTSEAIRTDILNAWRRWNTNSEMATE
jgi:hypothetical protein